ncbi:MAG TPA: hypothetical protein VFU78_04545 [Thermomicrobiales bacterium]|nr:hypothetical protein [Thermomicrobiales bacterium]
MTAPATPPRVEETAETIAITGAGYTLAIARGRPEAELRANGRLIATLNLASGADTTGADDEDTVLGPPSLHDDTDGVVVTWQGRSAVWAARHVELRAWADGFSYGYDLTGDGPLDRAHFFRTRAHAAPAPAGLRLFNPEPNSGRVQYTGERCDANKRCVLCHPDPLLGSAVSPLPADFATISVGREKTYHDGNWLFTPAPFCYAVEGAGNWLACGIAAAPGEWRFTDMRYPGGGFGFSLLYGGHTQVRGHWRSPRLVVLSAPDEYAAITRYRDWLRAAGLAPDHGRGPMHAWWREPIFCGWGEQVSQEVHAGGTPRAAAWATQAHYQRWLATLAAHDLHPGTIAIDDKWQRAYGLNDVDTEKWPDLAGFIRARHAQGQRVLLWLKAWDLEGLPPEECLRDSAGAPVAADPGHPAYQARLTAQVRTMLRDSGADGFKIDFTHLIPTGPSLAAAPVRETDETPWLVQPVTPSAGGQWGLELLRQWLALIADAAREAKPDALVMTHTANPYLADVVDMLRLNDVSGTLDPRASIVPEMRRRARIARAASPDWLLDADNWPCASRAQWRDYVRAQASGALGVPSLYHAERLGWGGANDALDEEDYAAVRATWAAYRARLAAEG